MIIRKLTAEAIGTFWLTFAGCGSAVIAAGFPEVGIGLLTDTATSAAAFYTAALVTVLGAFSRPRASSPTEDTR